MKNEKSGAGTAPAEFESTIGEYRVGVPFAPGNHHVDNVKLKAAELIDEMQKIVQAGGLGAREAAIAATEFESGCMWAVKAITKPPRD